MVWYAAVYIGTGTLKLNCSCNELLAFDSSKLTHCSLWSSGPEYMALCWKSAWLLGLVQPCSLCVTVGTLYPFLFLCYWNEASHKETKWAVCLGFSFVVLFFAWSAEMFEVAMLLVEEGGCSVLSHFTGYLCFSESHSAYKVAEECGSGRLWDQEDWCWEAGSSCSVSALQGELMLLLSLKKQAFECAGLVHFGDMISDFYLSLCLFAFLVGLSVNQG